MSFLRFAALTALTVLALPATAGAAKFNVFVQASQVTDWEQARQLDPSGCTWQEGRGRETARFRGAGVVDGTGDASSASWTYGGRQGIPLRGINVRSNRTVTQTDPAASGTACGPATPATRVAMRCGVRRATVFGRLQWEDNLLSLAVRDRNRALDFANCPVYTPRGVPKVGLGQVLQRARDVLSARYRKQTMEVRRTFRGTVRTGGRDVETVSVVRWKLTFYRYGAHR